MPDLTDAQKRLLDEHQGDTCEYEMGQCLGGCRPACPRSYCTSERHKGDVSPDWPCNVAAPILGYRNAASYWEAQDAAWLAIDRTAEKHGPDERCATNAHCYSHNVDELNEPGDYKVCGECCHIYRTADDLLALEQQFVEDINRTLPEHERIAPLTDADKIASCPLCTHDF